MASVYREGKTWTAAWFDSNHKRHYARGLPSKTLANMIAASQDHNREAAKHGVIDRKAEQRAREDDRALGKHLDEFCASKKATCTFQHLRETRELVERIFRAAGVERLSLLDKRKLVAACDALIDKGRSRRTRNKAMAACKTFLTWLRKHDRIPENVLDGEPLLDAQTDRRRVRKAMTEAEMVRLIQTTADQRERGGMTGIDRMVRYALGLGTGFRQRTLFALKPEDFHLSGGHRFIHVIAGNWKSKKEFDQPIGADLADMLRDWLKDKPAGRPVFTKLRWANPMNAYRQDLKAAGIEYHAAGTNEFCDQHAQRNAYITSVIRVAGLKVAQDLAQHSTPTLTSKYARMEMSDYAAAVDALPAVRRGKPGEGRATA